ncbi:hypothetical protein ACI2KR_27350 [Pseudomonas luteola]
MLVKTNQIWKDISHAGRNNRYVQVLEGPNSSGKVKIITRYASLRPGEMPVEVKDAVPTYARADRFNNRSDGYAYVATSIADFRRRKVHMIGFALNKPKQLQPVTGTGAVGEIWQEVCKDSLRLVEILGEVEGKKQIVTRYMTKVAGERAVVTPNAKPTYARADRFDGKSSGYRFVAASREALAKTGKLDERFIPGNDTFVFERVVALCGEPVKANQIYHDKSSTRMRLVEIQSISGTTVGLRSCYLGETEKEAAARIRWDQVEEVDLQEFANQRFLLVKSA